MDPAKFTDLKQIKEELTEFNAKIRIWKQHIAREEGNREPNQQNIRYAKRMIARLELAIQIHQQKLDKLDGC